MISRNTHNQTYLKNNFHLWIYEFIFKLNDVYALQNLIKLKLELGHSSFQFT